MKKSVRAVAILLAVLTTAAVACDSMGPPDNDLTDAERFLEAIAAINNGASVNILEERYGMKVNWKFTASFPIGNMAAGDPAGLRLSGRMTEWQNDGEGVAR